MKFAAAVAVSLFGCVAATGSPVERVVNLLTDLQTKIKEDGKQEQQIYDKYACWCEKTSARKGAAIEKAQDDLRSLGQSILKLKGKVAVLTAEIEELVQKIAQNEEEQAAATSLRQKENAAFQAETTELKQAISALQRATQVIVAGTTDDAASFLQTSTASNAVLSVLQRMPTSQGARLPKAADLALLSGFSKDASRYAPQSATVQGILKDMYETFASDLETSTQTEATANTDFETFIAIKTEELNAMKASKAKKEEQKAEAEALLADTTQSYDDTEAQMNADIEFFDATKSACEAKSTEWKTRADLRAEELEGIAKALEILSSDDARALFGSAIKAGKETNTEAKYDSGAVDISPASFLQLSRSSAPNVLAYEKIKKQARKAHSVRLAALAVQVHEAKVGHFDAVIKAIDEMMVTLKEEDAADIAKKDQCNEEYTKTASKIANITWLIQKNVAKIDKLEALIEKRTQEKEETIVAIAETQAEIERMTAQRHEEHEEFQHAKAEDEAALQLLLEARDVLSAYYKNNSIAMGPVQGSVKFLQGEPEFEISEDQAPDADFSGKGKRKDESKGIVSIMTYIIEDLNDEIKNGLRDEESNQLQFEKSLKAAEQLKADLEEKLANLETTIARLGEEKADEHRDMEENQEDLKNEQDYKAKITPDCDWIIGSFGERASKRAAELDGLTGAKELLAGMNTGEASMLQKEQGASLRKIHFLGLSQ